MIEKIDVNKVNINGVDYQVVLSDKPELEGVIHQGIIDYVDTTIEMNKNMSPSRAKTVFLHEIVHGIFEGMEINNEENVEKVTERLLHFIRNNPNVIKYLQLP